MTAHIIPVINYILNIYLSSPITLLFMVKKIKNIFRHNKVCPSKPTVNGGAWNTLNLDFEFLDFG